MIRSDTPASRQLALDPASIAFTHGVIAPHVRATPVLALRSDDVGVPACRLSLKLEYLQVSGSFKPRGAFANMLLRDVGPGGVVAASGGNHGAGVAYAASRLGHPAHVFVPSVASPAKLERIRACRATLTIAGDRYDDALRASREWAAAHDALEIHAFDQAETILGQGTLGVELSRQVPDADTVLVAVGGGGLIAGVAAWYAGRARVVGVEPRLAPTLSMALAAGQPVDAPAGGVAADSLAPRRTGVAGFDVVTRYVERVLLVEDEAIVRAQSLLWEVARIAAEPGGAAALAALVSGAYVPRRNESVVVIVCGGNTSVIPGPAVLSA
jgi:threonine dehydratase